MLHIGYHESSSGGFVAMGKEALNVNADTFAFFTRNPRGGQAKQIDESDAKNFVQFSKENNFVQLVAHAPYTMNPCSCDAGLREFAKNMMIDDISRMSFVPGNLYNFHPGSHVKQGVDVGIEFTAKMLSEVIRTCSENGTMQYTTILIETMAGKGSEIGGKFEEIKRIIDRTEELLGRHADELGVCMDSCHIWDGGYDISGNLDGVITEFDNVIGLSRLKACHLNDSLNDLNSHKDRHAKIGEGKIGFETLSNFVNHPALRNFPFILETPNESEGYAKEIALLREAYK